MTYTLPRSPSSPSPFIVRDGPRADDGFREDLREFISLRLDKVNPYAESEEYRRQQERAGRLFDAIGALLPAEGRVMLLEYGEALCRVLSGSGDAYGEGFFRWGEACIESIEDYIGCGKRARDED